jgi:hypothetical protein
MPALTVWAVCVGTKYHAAYVYALKEAVEKHLAIPHQFRCITYLRLRGIETVAPVLPYYGWWSKLNLFAPGIATGPSLYLDLDVVITGSLDYLAEYTEHEFAAPPNWAQSGYGGIQSSVMAWRGNWTAPYEYIKPQWPEVTKRLWGDQELLWEMLGDSWVRIPRGIYSYKYHCLRGPRPDDMAVCVFHGEPKPHEVMDEWLLPSTLILRSRIKSSMGIGSSEALSATG